MSDLERRLSSLAGDDEWARQRTLDELQSAALSASQIREIAESFAHDDAAIRASARMALAALAAPESHSRSTAQTALRRALTADLEDVRVLAASALGEAGDLDGGPALVEALSDPSPNVAAAAADALGELRYGPGLEPLGELTRTGDLWVRAAAVVALGRLHDERAVPLLAPVAEEPGLERPLAEALARIGQPSTLEILERIHQTAPDVAIGAAGRVLAAHPRVEAPGWVIDAAREREEALRLALIEEDEPAVARLVGLAGSPDSVECLVDLVGPPRWSEAAIAGLLAVAPGPRASAILDRLDDRDAREPDRDARELATLLSLLPPLDDPHRAERLVPFLEHEDPTVRSAAAEALARGAAAEALPLLAAEVDRERVAPEVVRAMGNLGESACGSLLPLLEDPSPEVRGAAASALVRCAGAGIETELRAALDGEGDPGAREAVIRALARVAGSDALDALDQALRSDRVDTRLAAIDGLGFTGDEAALQRLGEALRGSRAETIAAIRSLGELGVPAAAPLLRPYLDSDDLDVRRAAAREAIALADALEPESVEGLAGDEDGWIRTCAVRALARWGERGRDRLQQMAERDPDPSVRSAARRGLERG